MRVKPLEGTDSGCPEFVRADNEVHERVVGLRVEGIDEFADALRLCEFACLDRLDLQLFDRVVQRGCRNTSRWRPAELCEVFDLTAEIPERADQLDAQFLRQVGVGKCGPPIPVVAVGVQQVT